MRLRPTACASPSFTTRPNAIRPASSLLSGQYCIAAGDTALTHAVTSAEVLRDAGYFTVMTGKWHLDKEPTDFGFERYFGHLSGSTNFF